jgi:hypothetical protein
LLSASKRLVVFAGLLAAPVATNLGKSVPHPHLWITSEDPRLVRLKQFLAERECPLDRYAADLIRAADDNNLDWRLLPSISIVESSGGKYFQNNNVFGWNSCKEPRFSSVREGIHYVAFRLGNSDLYRQKSLDAMLRLYNPDAAYTVLVKSIMKAISTTEFPHAEAN